MASDSSGKKLTTAEILAKARGEKGGSGAASASDAAPPSSASAAPAAAAKPAAPQPAAPASTGKPKTTAEILAAARAQKAGGAAPAAEPAAETAAPAAKPAAAGGAKPKSTAEILAAARAAKGGAGEAPAAAKPAAAKPAAASAAGGAPKSTADILAAARAGKSAAAAPAAAPPAEKPASKPAAKGAVAAATADGPKLSVEEMLAAVRPAAAAPAEPKATPVLAPAAKVAPAAPVRPSAKPAAAKPGAKGAAGETRRGFLGTIAATIASPFVIAWTALTASAGFAGLGLARFMLPNVLTEPPSKFKIGPPTDYDLGTVATKWVAQFGIWIVHTDQYRSQNLIYALASVCTHLGCTPSWLEGERKFKCPCHGSGFYITGINFEGPAPRPLERVGIRLAEDGMLEVDKSVKFQEEMGQWNDAASFFEVTA